MRSDDLNFLCLSPLRAFAGHCLAVPSLSALPVDSPDRPLSQEKDGNAAQSRMSPASISRLLPLPPPSLPFLFITIRTPAFLTGPRRSRGFDPQQLERPQPSSGRWTVGAWEIRRQPGPAREGRPSAAALLPPKRFQSTPANPEGGKNVGTHCLIDRFGQTLIQDRASVLVGQFKIQRHQEGVSEVRPCLLEPRYYISEFICINIRTTRSS